MGDQKYDPVGDLTVSRYGWIILLVLQGIYLTLDALELSGAHKISYGVLSAIFMFFLGLIIIVLSLAKIKERPVHGFVEGGFYLFFASIIFYYKYRHFTEFNNNISDLETTAKNYDRLQAYTVQLRGMNQRLESINRKMALRSLKN